MQQPHHRQQSVGNSASYITTDPPLQGFIQTGLSCRSVCLDWVSPSIHGSILPSRCLSPSIQRCIYIWEVSRIISDQRGGQLLLIPRIVISFSEAGDRLCVLRSPVSLPAGVFMPAATLRCVHVFGEDDFTNSQTLKNCLRWSCKIIAHLKDGISMGTRARLFTSSGAFCFRMIPFKHLKVEKVSQTGLVGHQTKWR